MAKAIFEPIEGFGGWIRIFDNDDSQHGDPYENWTGIAFRPDKHEAEIGPYKGQPKQSHYRALVRLIKSMRLKEQGYQRVLFKRIR